MQQILEALPFSHSAAGRASHHASIHAHASSIAIIPLCGGMYIYMYVGGCVVCVIVGIPPFRGLFFRSNFFPTVSRCCFFLACCLC